ncbi:MAG: hypothetical protein ACD_10C00571G0001 [uncultured bacterium]|nr:MAG: hypothetical protein ACD_10C00571G0001 [uncultured bacterium]
MFCRAATALGNLAHRFKQLALGLCRAGVAPGSIESATVLQFKPIVVTEKIGRTDGAVSAGDCLAFVNQIRERKVERLGPMAHVFWRVFRVDRSIVAHNRHATDAQAGQLAAIAHQAFDDGLDVGAVVADKHHEQSVRAAAAGERVAVAVDVREVEVDGRLAKVNARWV